MSYRIRFITSWVFKKDMVPGTYHTNADFQRHAEMLMLTQFQGYKPEMTFDITVDGERATLAVLTWDVNLDDVPGAWHEPEDHVAAIEHHLGLLSYTLEVEVEHVLRHVDIASNEVQDHGVMLMEANAAGQRLDSSDYPVFIPQTHADWPEANEVFLQDGFWWWCANNSITGVEFAGPAVGPEPEKLFTPWTHDTRGKQYAAFKVAMDAAYPATR